MFYLKYFSILDLNLAGVYTGIIYANTDCWIIEKSDLEGIILLLW